MPHMTETRNIGEPTTLPITELNLHHKNARIGDVETIKGSMVANGVYKPIVVNKGTHTGRPNEVLAGNHSLKAMRQLAEENPSDPRWQNIAVWLVDVDEDRATRILLADNATADKGTYDQAGLLELLEAVDHDLDGTGYDYDDLEDLSALMEEIDTDDETPVPPAPAGGEAAPQPQSNDEASNLYEPKGQGHAAPAYADVPTRMMILHYPLDQFVWVNERLAELHEQHDEWDGANANALIALLEEKTGQKAPAAPENEE